MEILTYNYFNKIELPNFNIDNEQNINIIKSFNYFHELMSSANIKYVLTGSLGRSILTKTCYRTWNDLDILINIKLKDLSKYIEHHHYFINNNYLIQKQFYDKDFPKDFRDLVIKDLKHLVSIDLESIKFDNKNFMLIRDVISKRDLLKTKNYYQVIINNNIINIGFDFFYQSCGKNKPFINFCI
jgi:hypothetical protein